MADSKISDGNDIVTLQTTDIVPVVRPGNTTKYKATMAEAITLVKADTDIADAVSKKHVAATVSGNGISLTGQQVSLNIGTGSTQVAAGDHSHAYATETFKTLAVAGQSNIVADSATDTLTVVGGTGITVTTDASTDTLTITATGSAAPGNHATSHVTGGTDVIADAVAAGASGLMTGSDKTKLDGIAAGAEVNVNADWSSGSGDSQILNKPTLGTAAAANLGTGAGDAAYGNHAHTGVYAPAAQGVTNGDSHDHNGGDGGQINHTTLSNIGTNTHAAIDTALVADLAHRVDMDMCGFLNQTETTLALTGTTFTLAPVGSTWSYYRAGIKYTITGSKTATVSAATATTTFYYIYIDATDGTLSVSGTPWTLDNATTIPVATVVRNSGLTPVDLIGDERHTCKINRRDHFRGHTSGEGSAYVSGADITGQVVNSNTDTDKTCAISTGYFFDEDIYHNTVAVTDGDSTSQANYLIFYRTAVGAWAWYYSLMPFKYLVGGTTTTGAIQYDNAGTMTAATRGGGGSQRWVNYYLMLTNLHDGSNNELCGFIPGQAQYTTLAAAQAETFGSLNLAGFPSVDAVAVWKFTWHTNGTSVKGSCQLAELPTRVSGNIGSSVAISSTAHNSLAGLQGGALTEYYHLTAAEYAAKLSTAGGTMTGDLVAAAKSSPNNTTMVRNITISTSDPSGGSSGDIWLKYTA